MRDDRTPKQKEETVCFVNATDSFMSGWGKAPNKSYYCVACPDHSVAQEVESRMICRDDFEGVAISDSPRCGGVGCDTAIEWHEQFTYQPTFN